MDPVRQTDAVPESPASPCTSVCRMDTALDPAFGGLCAGCLRTLDEIADWAGASADMKRAIWARIGERSRRLGRGEIP